MKEVNWAKWSVIAEVVSSIAIVFTLLYLVVQTQQNTDALLATTRQAALETELEMLYESLERRDVNVAYFGSSTGPEYSTDGIDEQTLYEANIFNLIQFRMRESQWLNYKDGVLDRTVWESYLGVFVDSLRQSELLRTGWEFYAPMMTPGFKDEVDGLLKD